MVVQNHDGTAQNGIEVAGQYMVTSCDQYGDGCFVAS